MKITLVRHAEVIEAYQGRYNGHIDIPLSEYGFTQAKELALEIRKKNFDKIYCSDLLRAKQTLEMFALSLKPTFSTELREKSWGKDEGKSYDDLVKEGKTYQNFTQWIESLDGEQIESYQTRVREYFYDVILKSDANNILIVTHSGVIKTILGFIHNYSLKEAFSLKVEYGSLVALEL